MAAPPPKVRKTDAAERRRFLSSWKTEFPWVFMDDECNGMRCSYCIDAKKHNSFTTACNKFKKDSLKKHATTVDHRAALEARSARRDMQRAILHVNRSQEEAVIAALKTVYFMAKKNLANDIFGDIKQFLILQGSTRIAGLTFGSSRGGREFTYEHSESVRGFQEAVAAVVDEELTKQLQSAPFYSILIDESTDIATDHTLIMYVRFVHDGEVRMRFLEITELSSGTASAIFETVLRILDRKKLPLEKAYGMATDGASVMVGVRAGVTTLMKKKNPFMLSTHCIAHRLALASGQAADGIPYIKKYQQYINTIYKYYHYSPKHWSKLKEMQIILQCAETKFKQTFHTRWLSFEGAVEAILANLDPLMAALISDSESDPTAKGLLTFISTFRFLATTHFLADVLAVLSHLSKTFQRQCVDFTAVSDGVESSVAALNSFKLAPGPRLQKFISEVPSESELSESFYFKEQKVSDSTAQRQAFSTSKIQFLQKLVDNLYSRFPDSGLLSAFSILDPQKLPTESDLSLYGIHELETLCDHYGQSKTTEAGAEFLPVVDTIKTKDEWVVFRQLMGNNFRTCTLQTMAANLLPSAEVKETYPNLIKLMALALTMPVSTAGCERGFSKHNLIKNKIRARLKTENVATLMRMSLDTPDLSNMDTLNFSRAFEIWCNEKDRYICRQ